MASTPTFHKLDLLLTERCNLRCAWCYAGIGKFLPKSPDPRITEKAIRWFIGQRPADKSGRIFIWGGEPLLEWELLKTAVNLIRQYDASCGIGVISNLTLLTAERYEWLLGHGVVMAPSIDGTPEVIDTHRRDIAGRGQAEAVVAGARMVLRQAPHSNARMTVSPVTAPSLFASVRFLVEELGFVNVQYRLATGAAWTPEDVSVVKDQTSMIVDWWAEKTLAGHRLFIQDVGAMLPRVGKQRRLTHLCHAGIEVVAVDPAGNLWPCHRFSSGSASREYCFGNLDQGIAADALPLLEALRGFDPSTACNRCAACGSEWAFCLHEMMVAQKGMFTPNTFYCAFAPFLLQEAERLAARLQAAGVPLPRAVKRDEVLKS